MPDIDGEEYYDSDISDNEENHSKLLSSVSQLDSTQRVKPAQRKEITSTVSEYTLTEKIPSQNNLISVNELANVLGKSSKHVVITKKLKNVTSKARTLPKPLEKHVEQKIKRSVGFENLKKQLRRWDAVVTRNALKDHIKFPLNDNSIQKQKSGEFLSQFKSTTPLEEEIAKVLNQDNKNDKEDDEYKEFTLTLEEMLEKRREMASLRAKLSYREAKAQRQSKIKSKKYHRILKREKLRQQLKEFELLQKTDPEAALKKLEELDKTRAQERASLRHRNTGQWAKNLTVRAKYDTESRKILAEQLKISRELTQKVHQLDDSDREDIEEPWNALNGDPKFEERSKFQDNPWNLSVSKEMQDFVSGYRKYWSEQNKAAEENSPNKETANPQTEKDTENTDDSPQNGEIQEKMVEEPKTGCAEIQEPKMDVKKPTEVKKKSKMSKEPTNDEIQEIVEKPKAEEIQERKINGSEKKVENVKRTPKNDEIQEIVEKPKSEEIQERKINGKKPRKVKKKSEKSKQPKKTKSVCVYPSSGVWIVSPMDEPEQKVQKKKKNDAQREIKNVDIQRKRKNVDIDTLFEELDERLLADADAKVQKMKEQLQEEKPKKMRKTTEHEFDLSLKHKLTAERPDMDVGLLEGDEGDVETPKTTLPTESDTSKNITDIDPKNFIQVKPKKLRTCLPDDITGEENDENTQVMTIEEAFVDDDVIAEFKEMKEEEEKSKEIELETSLPGWGSWGGLGITPKVKKKSRLVVNVPAKKKKEKPDVIVNENANPNLRNHLVKEVPHPFQSVEAFEANIRAPVGREWVPETAHWKLIQKQVETKLGAVIDPMDEEEIVREKKPHKSPYRGKVKDKKKVS